MLGYAWQLVSRGTPSDSIFNRRQHVKQIKHHIHTGLFAGTKTQLAVELLALGLAVLAEPVCPQGAVVSHRAVLAEMPGLLPITGAHAK